MWCVAQFATICTIWKTWKTPMEECYDRLLPESFLYFYPSSSEDFQYHMRLFSYLSFLPSCSTVPLSFCSYCFQIVILLLAAILPLVSMCMWKSLLFLDTQIIMLCLLMLVPLLLVIFLTYIIWIMLTQTIFGDGLLKQMTILTCLHLNMFTLKHVYT